MGEWLAAQWLSIALDITFVSFLIYTVLILVQGTRGQAMLLGLGIVGILYVFSREMNLVTLNWILGNFLGSAILVIVVLFQDDLRRGLIKVGLMPGLSQGASRALESTIRDVARTASELSSKKVGALIVLRRDVGLDEYIEHAVRLDAQVSYQLLVSIFQKPSPLHDGAVIIERDRIVVAGAVLPLTFEASASGTYGTRHRAALGLSEHTDALTVVVSEESGRISLVREGRITSDFDEKSLYNALYRLTVARRRRRFRSRRAPTPIRSEVIPTVDDDGNPTKES